MIARTKAVEIVPYSGALKVETIAFFNRVSPDYPELASGDLLDWQRSQRFLALFQGRIVGHIARIPQLFRRDCQEIRLGWAATLVLDTALPLVQTFAGNELLNRLTASADYRFAAVGVVPEIEPAHRRRGYNVNRGAVSMFARFLKSKAMLRYLGRSKAFALPIAAINTLRPLAKTAGAPTAREIDRFEPEWDSCWDRMLNSQGRMYGLRAADYLNYKLSQPGKRYTVLLAGNPETESCGYVIFRVAINSVKELTLLKIVDLVGSPDAKAELLAKAVAEAVRYSADGIVALDAASERSLYAKAGLWAQRVFPVIVPPDLDGDMRVTFLDSDLDDLW